MFICNTCGMSDYNNYDMISDNVAIGDHTSSYDPFDVIINLNYPYNQAEYQTIHFDRYNNGKIVIRVGLLDKPDEKMYSLLTILIPILVQIYQSSNKSTKFLFHCYAGVSRSSTVAIAFLAFITKLRPEEVFNYAKLRRPVISPNQGFITDLLQFFR